MPAARPLLLPDWREPSMRRRAVALALALILQALFILALLWQVFPRPQATSSSLITLDVRGDKAAPKAQKHAAAKKAEQRRPPREKRPQPDATKTDRPSSAIVIVTRKDFDEGDIAKLPSHKAEGGGAGADSAAAYGPGEGPGGAPLYNAEWYREPTDGELALYLGNKERPAGAWATIACQTIARYHVDNCRSMGESPPGSGLASAIRQAAWQFLVRPPRVGDKPMIGAWVRIRIDFIHGVAEAKR